MTEALVKWQVNGGYRTGRKVLDLDGFTVSCVKDGVTYYLIRESCTLENVWAVATDVERWEPEN